MNAKRRTNEPHGIPLRRWLVAAALASLSLTTWAGTTSRSEFDAFTDLLTGGTKHTVTFGSNGTPIITNGVPGPTRAGNMNFSHTPGGWPGAGGTVCIPSPIAGKCGNATARQGFTKASMGSALAKFGSRVGPLATGMAIYDLFNELGLACTWSGDVNACTQGSGYQQIEYNTGGVGFNLSTWSGNKENACEARRQWWQDKPTKPQGWTYTKGGAPAGNTWANSTHCVVYEYNQLGQFQKSETYVFVSQTVQSEPEVMSEQEIADLIASQSGWGGASAIDRALADAVNANQPLVTEGDTAVTVAPNTKVNAEPVTTTSSDGATSTSQQTCDLVQLQTGSVEWRCGTVTTVGTPARTVIETVTTTNPDGTTSTHTVTRTTPGGTVTTTTTGAEQPSSESECAKSPDTLGCSKLGDVPTLEVPKETKEITYAPDNLGFGGGQCMSPTQFTTSGGTHTLEWTPYCDMLSNVLKPLVIAFALLAAVFIIMPRET